MLSQLLTTSAVLPNMDSMILIMHMNPSWPQSSPSYKFCSSGLPVTIPLPWIYCVTQLDSILHADDIITTSAL